MPDINISVNNGASFAITVEPAPNVYVTVAAGPSTQALQTQLNQIVIAGDSSVEAAQARTNAAGYSWSVLRDRLNAGDADVAGKVAKAGDTMTGKLGLEKGFSVHHSEGTLGSAGYFHVCRITIGRTWANAPIEIDMMQRGVEATTTLRLLFSSTGDLDPGIQKFTYTGNPIGVYIAKAATGVWDVYLTQSEANDDLTIMDFRTPRYMDNVAITWGTTQVSSLPDGYIAATYKTPSIIEAGVTTVNGLLSLLGLSMSSTTTPATASKYTLGEFKLTKIGNIVIAHIKYTGASIASGYVADNAIIPDGYRPAFANVALNAFIPNSTVIAKPLAFNTGVVGVRLSADLTNTDFVYDGVWTTA